MAEVGRVTAEQLVRALAREHDLHVLPRRLREQIRGQDRRIPHRLGERAGHQLEGPLQGGVVSRDDVMRRADVAGDGQGVCALVVPGLDELHRIGVDLLAREHPGRCGREQRRIEPAAREHPDRHIRHELPLDRGEQHTAELRRGFELRGPGRHRGGIPVRMDRDARRARHEEVGRRELMDAREHRVRRRDVAQGGVERGRPRVEPPRLVGVGEQGLDLGREPQLAVGPCPKERLLAGAVAGEHQHAAPVVPDGEAEHPLQPPHAFRSEALVQGDDRLNVTGRAERIAGRRVLAAQRRRVVDLAVADHPHGSVGALERLIAGREVHDGEPPRAQTRPLVPHDAVAVGSAMRERRRHGGKAVAVSQRRARERHRAVDPAHYLTP